jgi:hypothetical protein
MGPITKRPFESAMIVSGDPTFAEEVRISLTYGIGAPVESSRKRPTAPAAPGDSGGGGRKGPMPTEREAQPVVTRSERMAAGQDLVIDRSRMGDSRGLTPAHHLRGAAQNKQPSGKLGPFPVPSKALAAPRLVHALVRWR